MRPHAQEGAMVHSESFPWHAVQPDASVHCWAAGRMVPEDDLWLPNNICGPCCRQPRSILVRLVVMHAKGSLLGNH